MTLAAETAICALADAEDNKHFKRSWTQITMSNPQSSANWFFGSPPALASAPSDHPVKPSSSKSEPRT